ncbi:ABC transporter ATP-binding protein [Treponema bryantii]|uniref:ABC transporter ATP-binding protein n=1 Tax=Treponema bryantii TaxID=163 RepID=UPI0003B67AE1|nr:ABC transporter ATP-binding protein [Treponema bryantii]
MRVRIDNVTKTFGHTTAVSNFSAELEDGHLICLLGPSGCGKSTLLNMLCGIIPVTQGQIFFDDKNVTKLPPDQRNIGMVFQNYALYPHMTVAENIAFPLEVLKVKKDERKARVEEIAKLVHVDNLLRRYPSELSGGQQQRVAIARAMVKKPQLLLMDEPLSNLDARLRLEMREEIRRIQKETGVTTVFVTHDQEEAMSISDSILLMKDGLLIQSGLCQELYVNPNCLFVAEFLGNPPANKLPASVVECEQSERIETTATTVAIRPEAFTLDPNGIEAEIQFISEMGKDQIVTMTYLGNTVRAILNLEDSALATGSKIKVSLKKKGVFTFDKEGRRLS